MSKVKKTLRPLNERVVIIPEEREEKTPGGIVLPDQARRKTGRGTVVAVGPGYRLEDGSHVPLALKPGDVVQYGIYSGVEYIEHPAAEVELDHQRLQVMSARDILCVLEEDPK